MLIVQQHCFPQCSLTCNLGSFFKRFKGVRYRNMVKVMTTVAEFLNALTVMAYTPLKMACTQMFRCGLRTWTPCWTTTRSCVLWVVKSFKWPFRWTSSLRLNFYTNTWSTGRNYLHYENALLYIHLSLFAEFVCVLRLFELLVEHRFSRLVSRHVEILGKLWDCIFLELVFKITSNYQIYLTNGPGSLQYTFAAEEDNSCCSVLVRSRSLREIRSLNLKLIWTRKILFLV